MTEELRYQFGGMLQYRADHGFVYMLFDKREPAVIRYIGQTMYLIDRWHRHIRDAYNANSNSYNNPSARWIRKIGKENLAMKPVSYVPLARLDGEEIYYIAKYKSPKLRNISAGGKGGLRGVARSEETKKKISTSKLGKPQPWNAGEKHYNYGNTSIPANKIADVVSMRLEGMTLQDIANVFKVSRGAVTTVLKGKDPSLGLRAKNKLLLTQGLKKCSKCFETKSLEQYVNDRSKPSGKASICKPCKRGTT